MAWAWTISELDQADTPLEWCSDGVMDLGTVVSKVTSAQTAVVSPWRDIRQEDTYSGPGDEELFSAMKPVEIGCAELVEDLKLLADALDTLHTEGAEQKRKLASLRSEAARLYEETWGHDPESPFYEGPQVGSDFSGWDYKEVIDGTLTRWEYGSQYQQFAEKNADLCARIKHVVQGYDDVVDECVRTINGIGWEPWWNPSGLTPQGSSQMAPQIDPGVAIQAETALAAQGVNQALANGLMSPGEAAGIQSIFDSHLSDPQWMSQFVLLLGGGMVMMLLDQVGSNALVDPDGLWISLGQSVRCGVSVASQQWDQGTAQGFSDELLGVPDPLAHPSVVGFLFADPQNALMGSAFTMAVVSTLASEELELGSAIVDETVWPSGVGLAGGDASMLDPMGSVLSTLAMYPTSSLVFFADPSDAGMVQWLLENRPYQDGFTGVTAALLASQSVDDMCVAGLGGQTSESAEAMVVSQTSVWLGHNPNLPSMSDQAKDNVFNILSPYQQLFLQSVDTDTPGISPLKTDGLPTERNPLTGRIDNLPKLDMGGLAALVGRSSDTDEGKQKWVDNLRVITAEELDNAVNSSTDPKAQVHNINDAEERYFQSVGFVMGSSAGTAILDGRDSDAEVARVLGLVDQDVGAVASFAAGKGGEAAGALMGGPVGAVAGGELASWAVQKGVDYGVNTIDNYLETAENDAITNQRTLAQEMVHDTISNWNDYYTSSGYPEITSSDPTVGEVTYNTLRDDLVTWYFNAGQDALHEDDLDELLPRE